MLAVAKEQLKKEQEEDAVSAKSPVKVKPVKK